MRRFRAFSTSTRFFSADPPASTVAASFLSKFQSSGPQSRTQSLDANQLHLLSQTLGHSSHVDASSSPVTDVSGSPSIGTPVPPGYHLVYFTPGFVEDGLGTDGTDVSYNPESPFTRRMWAGGEVVWPRDAGGRPNPLRVGQQVRERTRVLSAEAKIVKKTGEEMIVVGVEKEFSNEEGVAVLDRRNWAFRKALPVPNPSMSTPSTSLPPSTSHLSRASASAIVSEDNTHSRTFVQSPVTLFRFSALTFNPHKIHYSLPWARDVEGHRDVVVHGPLNLILMLDLWRDVQSRKIDYVEEKGILPRSISYRATSPLYAGDRYDVVLQDESDVARLQILGPGGIVAMKAEIQG
ncbi:Uncharacterized protein PECH_003533 [Penicillium ucsense]|uniref:Mesaconyl-C4 CoA hydratase n=1 Tax=Penicillium ucsense TaxID=2839758 RepID=A0A8J8W0Q0_9EURO|nr:Uncharacterized protein PECM_007422 [Penicillium ucsense]KAF7737613.1 Uncharacterized protein PECH_003533 [Penicillium ucsense]